MNNQGDPGGSHPERDRRRFLRSAGSVSAAVGLSRITGLAREMLMARLFGASAAYDAFLLGFRIPNLSRDLFAEGALSSAFIPTFSQYLAGPGEREAAELSNIVATALVLATGAMCVAGIVFSPQLVSLLAPGFAQVPGKFALAVTLTRIMFPFLTLVALAAQAMGVLNARGRFGIPALASTFFNIGSVTFGLAMAWTVGRTFHQGLIVSMACGVLAGGALQWLWQVPSMAREGFRYRPCFNWRHHRSAPDRPLDAARAARERRAADQRHGEHQPRVEHHGRGGACHRWTGELAELRFPFSPAPHRRVRRCGGLRHTAGNLALRRARPHRRIPGHGFRARWNSYCS